MEQNMKIMCVTIDAVKWTHLFTFGSLKYKIKDKQLEGAKNAAIAQRRSDGRSTCDPPPREKNPEPELEPESPLGPAGPLSPFMPFSPLTPFSPLGPAETRTQRFCF